jgi:hypothetical protein
MVVRAAVTVVTAQDIENLKDLIVEANQNPGSNPIFNLIGAGTASASDLPGRLSSRQLSLLVLSLQFKIEVMANYIKIPLSLNPGRTFSKLPAVTINSV